MASFAFRTRRTTDSKSKRNVCDCLSNIILHCDIVVAKLQRLLIPLLFIEGKYNCIFIKKFSIWRQNSFGKLKSSLKMAKHLENLVWARKSAWIWRLLYYWNVLVLWFRPPLRHSNLSHSRTHDVQEVQRSSEGRAAVPRQSGRQSFCFEF